MSDEKALLAAIWEHPHEDTPRLMYADWLQEHDQPERAEFIRVQVEAANLSTFDPEKVTKARHARQLLARHVEEWIEPFRWAFAEHQPVAWDNGPSSPARIWKTAVGVTGEDGAEVRFERGFVSDVTATLATLLNHTRNPLRITPRPKISVKWPYGEPRVEPNHVFPKLLEHLTFDRFSGWQFAGPGSIGDDGVTALANEPDLVSGLTSLDASLLTPVKSLRGVLPLAKRLTHLSSSLTDEESQELLLLIRVAIESKVNETLTDFVAVNLFPEYLDISAVITELATSPWPKLKRLLLYCWSGGSHLTAGIKGNPFPQLEELTLLGIEISRAQLTDVLECPALRHARMRYYENEDAKRPDLRELEEQYAPRFRCST